MFLKIIFTFAVIIIAYLFIQKQRRSKLLPTKTAKQQQRQTRKLTQMAYLFIAAMTIISMIIFYYDYHKDQRVINVHIINTQTGAKTSYKAHRGDITGRSFITVTDDTIFLADIERMELEGLN
jgi:uncharacterized membrane protein